VILVEMIAQVGGLAAAAPDDPGVSGEQPPVRLRVAGLGPFKFPRAAQPGTSVDIAVRVAGKLGGLYKIEGEVTSEGHVVAVGSVTLGSAPASPPRVA
jgi:3-hydroxymyristoyl/3-hydroxydecanoyl-(acyl carrier protein) dehydratase